MIKEVFNLPLEIATVINLCILLSRENDLIKKNMISLEPAFMLAGAPQQLVMLM